MLKFSRLAGLAGAAVLAVMWIMPAQAQATRTWISGVGDDVNPCSRTAPCKTFAGAISKTAGGGEIDCLDPGGFGTVTITKSITLDCGGGIGGQVGSILASGVSGIIVNAVDTAKVVKIRNLTINGISAATSGAGLSGIRVLSANAVVIEHVGIFEMGGTNGSNAGVDVEPAAATKLEMLDDEIQFGTQDGILLKPQAGGSINATLVRVSSFANGQSGFKADTTGTAVLAGVNATIRDSNFSGNLAGVSINGPATTAGVNVMVTGSTVSGNTGIGLASNGVSTANLRVGGSTISGNGPAIVQGGTSVLSTYGDNYVNGNASNETFPNTAIPKH